MAKSMPPNKILVATGLGPGVYAFGNMGDVAMLQSCLARLAVMWPSAETTVFIDVPDELDRFCPGSIPLSTVGRDLFFGGDLFLGRLEKYLPRTIRHLAVKSKALTAARLPKLLQYCINGRLRLQHRQAEISALSNFLEVLLRTDLVVVCGAGGFYDGCRDWNIPILNTVEAALSRRIPVVMFGQHFGPLSDPPVVSRAKRLLPKVNLITLRGNPGARTLLESFGVRNSRIMVTGDEAIEIAYKATSAKPGIHFGVNFRLGGSAETDLIDIEKLKPILHRFSVKHGVSLILIPIALDSYTCDQRPLKIILQGLDDLSDGGASLESPIQIINEIGRCRVLLTFAYHAAVFALSQGIPVVALAKSRYFVEKFQGLRDMFGDGVEIIYLDHPDAMNRVEGVIESVWKSAESLRAPLQKAALRQVELSMDAYKKAKEIVANHADNGLA
jgi:colanic acid/amylovoran biosynthesis protein